MTVPDEVLSERIAHSLGVARDRGFADGVTAGVEVLARALEAVMEANAAAGSTTLPHEVVAVVLRTVRAEVGPRV